MRTREECVVCALWTDRRAPQLDSQRLGFLAATVVVRGERHQWRCAAGRYRFWPTRRGRRAEWLGSFLRGFANKRREFFHHMGQWAKYHSVKRVSSGLEVVWGYNVHFLQGQKGPFGGFFLLPETGRCAGADKSLGRI